MKKYTQREFLKMLGLGMAFLPMAGCFHAVNHNESAEQEGDTVSGDRKQGGQAEIEVTDDDVVLLTRSEEAYAEFNRAFNKRIHYLPKYIAVCKTERGVQFTIRKARKEHLKIAVKSGGHSFEGFSSNDGGMVINLSRMKKITWLENDRVVIEPGCLLQEIQDMFFAKKRLLPAGSCGTVGIAGLALGGGYGFFSRRYGLTCDSLLRMSMVAADGEIYDTDQHPELLWACKGGGNGNFGAITSFTFRHYEMPPSFSAYTLKYSNLEVKKFSTVLDTWFDVTRYLPDESFSAFVLNGNFITILVTTFKGAPDFENLFVSLIKQADRYSKSVNKDLPGMMKRYYGRKGPIYFKNASGGMYRGKEDLSPCKEALFEKVASNPGIIYQINTLGGKVADKDYEAASCFPHRALPYLSELQSYWNKADEEEKMATTFEAIQQLLRSAGIGAHYRNYPDIRFTDWPSAYYGNNYSRLQSVKRKYDPDDLFHYPQSIEL
jgi:hypothetical protein